jgi:acyl-CoA thioester hydrolase
MTRRAEPFPLRVYYEDTDFSGAVYHARYLHFFERGRTEALRALGIDQSRLFAAAGGPQLFVVRRMTIEYHRAARMDDLLLVETTVAAITGARIAMRQRLLRDGNAIAEAELELGFLVRGRPARVPAEIAAALALITKG